METSSRRDRQFSLRFIFLVTTGVAILCAGSTFAYRSITEKARHDEERRQEARRRHDRALAEWEQHEDPGSWDFGF
jgi:hypothetical protein